MKSSARTVEEYLASLPADRREAISHVRGFILEHLDADLVECMQYGVIAYCVPHRVWPHGHHTNPKLMPMYLGLSSQKNDMVVYMLLLLHNEPERAWFDKAWKATGRASHLEVGGMGCCLRFKKLEELSLDVIGEAMGRVPVATYLDNLTAMLARLGKGPDGKAIKGAKPATTKAAPITKTRSRSGQAPRAKPATPSKKKASTRRRDAQG